MRKLGLALSLALWALAPAHAQNNFRMPPTAGVSVLGVQVVTACGAGALSITLPGYLSMDTTGALCTNASGGGGGGAVTIADGADVTQGAKADSAWVSGDGTVVALLKNLATGVASPVPTNPKTTTQAKVTIAVTNTYQQAIASSASRVGCTIQYIAVAGTKGYVFLGAAPADTTTSFQLTNGQTLNCNIGGVAVAQDAIQVTATATDIFIVANQ